MIGRTNVGGGGAAAPVLEEITVNASGTYTPSTGYDGISKVVASFNESDELTLLRKLINGTATSLTVPSTMTSVAAHLCRKDSSSSTLTSVDLANVATIGQYAFYYNTYISWVLQQVDGVDYFPRGVNNIGAYAMYYAGYNKRSSNVFVLHPSSTASVGNYAFYYANCAKVKGTYSSIGQYAFQYCNTNEIDLTCTSAIGYAAFQYCPLVSASIVCAGLGGYALNVTGSAFTTLYLKVTGAISDYALDGTQYISNFTFDPASVVSGALGSYAFRGLGSRRSGTTTFELDFGNSTFTSVGSCAFYPTNTSYPLKNMHIVLPATVTTINSQAFQYLKDSEVECKSATPPTVSAANAFQNWSNTYLTCPPNSVGAYREKANYTAIASYIRGKLSGVTELPDINTEGYELTWYTDVACTQAVQSGDTISASTAYYCTASAQKVAYPIIFTAVGCTVAPTDANNRVYASGEMVRTGTVLTLNVTGDQATPTPYIQTINGTNFTAGDTHTVAGDIAITCLYWDEVNVPVNPNFADNSWGLIKLGCQLGLASQFWSIGDTKSVTLTDGRTYTVRIADLVENRYQYADGTTGGTHAVFEFVELINANGTTTFNMNDSNTNSGGFNGSKMKSTHLGQTIYNLLPTDLKEALEEVTVYSANGSGSTMVGANTKLFLASAYEIFASGTASSYSYDDTQSKGRYQIYAASANDNATFRKKYDYGTSTARAWWLRSPRRDYSYYFVYVDTSGYIDRSYASSACRVAPCFAF